MRLELALTEITVLAQNLDPSVIDRLWLVRRGVTTEEELEGAGVVLPQVVQLQTAAVVIWALPDRIKIVTRGPTAGMQDQAPAVGRRLVKALGSQEYTAVGLNFHWNAVPEEEGEADRLSRTLFLGTSDLHRAFNKRSSRFGGYLSRDFGRFRLHLTVRPLMQKLRGSQREVVELNFNFHADVGGQRSKRKATGCIGEWARAAAAAKKIAETTTGVEAHDMAG